MPATDLTLYMGSTFDLSFGGAGFSWETAPTPAAINDAANVPNDPSYGLWRPSFAVSRDVYAEYRLASVPIGIVSIASLRLCAWVMATGTGGTYDTDVSAMTHPSAEVGATDDFYSSPLTLTSSSAALEVFSLLEFSAWTTNPLTSSAWTKGDLAAASFGVRFQAPATDPVLNPSIKLGRLFAIIEATSLAADTGAVRTAGSTVLWQLCRAREPVRVVGPADLADVGLTEMFFMSHPRGRRPNGPGWGRKAWERGALQAMSKSIDPITGLVTIEGEERRSRLIRYWLPGLTNVGHSLDGQGLPILHSGGGPPVVDRNGVKYIERPGNPTDHVLNGVTEDLLAHDQRGMAIEAGDDTNLVVNSTFSQGSGDAFDGWTSVESGTGTATEETGRFGVDEVGLRRSVLLNVGVTDSSDAAVSQDIAVSGDCRLGIRTYNNFGADRLSVAIQRAADSKYWRDSDETWQVALQANRIGNDAGGYMDWVSNLITSGADTLTLIIGYLGEAGSVLGGVGYQAVVWSVDLCVGVDHIGTPIITTVEPVARIGDVARIPNNAVGRWWSFDLGGFSWSLGGIPLWDGPDLAESEVRVLLHVDHGTGGYSQIAYQRGAGAVPNRFVFSIFHESVAYTAAFPVEDIADKEPERNRVVKLSGYYIGTLGELDLTPGEINIAVNDEWGDEPATLPSVPEMGAVSTGYLGHAFTGVLEDEGSPTGWWNGFVRQVRILPVVLRPEELERNPS